MSPTVEQDVFLGVDGSQIGRAFDTIDARIANVEKHIGLIVTRSKQAADAFGGGLQQQLQKVNSTVAALERFEKNVNKNDPGVRKAEEINKAFAQREKTLLDAQNKRFTQETQMFAAQERTQLNTAAKIEQTKERLAAQRWERERAAELKTEREVSRLREQNRLKSGQERIRADVEGARGVRDLENQRLQAVNRITEARRLLGKLGADEDRQLHQVIALERQRLQLASARIKTEQSSVTRVVNSDATVDGRLNIRSARTAERELAATLNLGTAKARQADLEARIATQIERARVATGLEKVEGERVLRVDEARLTVINRRVAALQREHDASVRSAQPRPGFIGPPLPPGFKPPAQPAAPDDGGGRGIFGSTGLPGVFLRTGAYAAAATAIFGVVGAIRDGITFSLQFEDNLARLSAIAGVTSTQMEELEDSISEVGRNSRFSTLELAEAATVLAQAGFTQGEIAESLGSISQLATASGVTIAEATDVVTAAIGSFQLQASETSHINDVLASALNRTKLNIQQVALGIQFAGATAKENNVSFEELTAVMATMANAGIRSGSTIGTGLRQFLVDLQTPTKKMTEELTKLGLSLEDINVDRLGLPEVLRRMAEAGFDSASAYRSLETRAAAAFLVLRNNREEIQQQIIAQNDVGQSAEGAAKGQASLTAEWQRSKNILNDYVSDGLEPATEALAEYLRVSNDVSSAADTDPEILRLRKVLDDTSFLNTTGIQLAQIALAEREHQIKKSVEAEAELADAIEETTTALNKANDEVAAQQTTLSTLDDSISRVVVRGGELSTNQLALQAEVSTLTTRFSGLALFLDDTTLSYQNLTGALHAYRVEQLKTLSLNLEAQGSAASAQSFAFTDQANARIRTAKKSGAFSRLSLEEQNAITAAGRNPSNSDASGQSRARLRALGDAQKDPELKALLLGFAGDIVGSVRTRVAESTAFKQKGVTDLLATPKFSKLVSEASELAGKPRAAQDAFIAARQADIKAAPGKENEATRGALSSLITTAQNAIGNGATPRGPDSSSNSASTARRKEREEDRRETALASARLKATEAELAQSLKGLLDVGGGGDSVPGEINVTRNRTLTDEQFKKNLERVDAALDKWIEDRTAQVEAQIDALPGDGGEQGELIRAELVREIAAKREDAARAVTDQVVKAINLMVEATERVAEAAERAADQAVALADARVRALGRADLEGKVPDFVRANAQRQANRATDDRDRAKIGINQKKIDGLNEDLQAAQNLRDAAELKGLTDEAGKAAQTVADLKIQIQELTDANAVLQASLSGQILIPQSFSEAWRQAVENFREAQNLTATWSEMINQNLGGAIETVSGSMEEFLGNILSGTVTVKEAFRSMVQSIIQFLIKLIAKMLVVKLLQLAIGGVGGGAAADPGAAVSASGSGAFGSAFQDFGQVPGFGSGSFNGGRIERSNGGRVENGVPSRDSVTTRLAKGEFVTRKKAVDSVGVDFMARLNERGVGALKAMAPRVILPPPSRQEMSVYVLAEGEKPQMGPNDVIAVINRDIIQGGQTKQLIRHISQGG